MTSLSEMKYLKNIKAAFESWEDGSYNKKYFASLSVKAGFDDQISYPVYGISNFCSFITSLSFAPEAIYRLASLKENQRAIFNESFLNFLQRLQFGFDLKALSDGEFAKSGSELLCLRINKIELKIIEDALPDMLRQENKLRGELQAQFELKATEIQTSDQMSYENSNLKEICRAGKIIYFPGFLGSD